MAFILHIDTSGDSGFVAISLNGKIIASKDSNDSRNHASILNNDINEVIKHARISLNTLSAVAVNGGPGSYTGLRIALATAKATCYVLDKPLIMHNRLLLMMLDSYYQYLSEYDVYVSILPARDNEYFISAHDNKLNAIVAPKHIFKEELSMIFNELSGKILTVGNISVSLMQTSGITTDIIEKNTVDEGAWGKYGFEQYNCNNFANLSSAEPYYLKQVYTHNQKTIK